MIGRMARGSAGVCAWKPERKLLVKTGLLIALLETAMLLGGPLAAASSVTSASISGGAGAYRDPVSGVLYIRQSGGQLGVTATTSADTRCLRVQGTTPSIDQAFTSSVAKSSWDVALPVTVTGGSVSLKVSASPSFNVNGKCTGTSSGDVTATANVVVDNTAPVVNGARVPGANAAGWNNTDVAISWSATDPDPGAGVAPGSPSPATDAVVGNTSAAGVEKTSEAFDRVGNRGTGSLTVKVDKTAPSIGAARTPAANGDGWNNSDVTVSFACADGLSGIGSCPAAVTLGDEGASLSVSRAAVDNAGNSATATAGPIGIDKQGPSLSGAAATPAVDGWHRDDVTIAWTCGDALSGVKSCPSDSLVSGEGAGLSVTGTATDKAGNATTGASAPVNVDRHAPVTQPVAPGGWSNAAQNVKLIANDALSGVKSTRFVLDGGAAQAYDAAAGIDVGGHGVHTLEFWSADKAGNVEAHQTVDVRIDTAAPTITHAFSQAANANGWHRQDVTVTFECDDADSGVASCTAPATVSDEGASRQVTGTALDHAGNAATDVAHVALDKSSPAITAERSAQPNADGWNAAPVEVVYACADELSGIDSCSAPDTVGEGASQTVTGRARDAAGNEATVDEGPISVDLTAPTLAGHATTAANAHGWYDGDVTIGWTCDDALAGVRACPDPVTITGEGAGLAAQGSVSDKAGNTTEALSDAVSIDRHAPSTTIAVPDALPSGWYAGGVQVTLSAADSLSGVAQTLYSVDGGSAREYDGPFVHALPGSHTLRFWSTDKAGNGEPHGDEGHAITIRIDDVAPTIDGAAVQAANAHGWNNTDVEVSFACDDYESGIAACVGDRTLTQETDGTSVTGNAADLAGNTSEKTVGPIRIDKTKPDVDAQLPDPNGVDPDGARWYTADVNVSWPCSDGLSGLAGGCPEGSAIDGEGRNLGAGPVSVEDKAGNSASASASGVNIDRRGPAIRPLVPPANAAGWYDGVVEIGFDCADPALAGGGAGSGVAACPKPVAVETEGRNQTVESDPAADYAGNVTPGAAIAGLNVDATPPETASAVECTKVAGYCNGGSPVTVRLAAADQPGLSGVEKIGYSVDGGAWHDAAGDAVDVSLGVLATSGQATVRFRATDVAGNVEPVRTETINHDGAKPTVTHALDPDANAAGWSRHDTLVTFSASDDDNGSGVDLGSLTPPHSYVDETAGRLISGEALDRAGNRGTDTFTFKLDKTAPTIAGTRSPAGGNANGWSNRPVTVSFACADPDAANGAAGSGVAECTGGRTLSTNNRTGEPQSVTGVATDLAGNGAQATVGGINIDTEPPSVSIEDVADDAKYTLGAVPTPACRASDSFSGLDGGCRTTLTGGSANGVGQYAYTATATDKAGNATTKTVRYSVLYSVPGDQPFFLQPINDTGHTVSQTLSVFKAGSTVPVKFRLRDAGGRVVQANSAPVWLAPAQGGMTTAPVDESVFSAPADTGSAYRWSAADQHYMYNWQTAKSQLGHYWRIGVKLDDGQTVTTLVGLR